MAYHFSAVNEVVLVLAKGREHLEDELEHRMRLRLVVDERLPLASCARVTRDRVVALQAHLSSERALHLALVAPLSGEQRPAQLRLHEELRVPDLGGRDERQAGLGRVDIVGRRDGVRRQKPDSENGVEVALGRVGETESKIWSGVWNGSGTRPSGAG